MLDSILMIAVTGTLLLALGIDLALLNRLAGKESSEGISSTAPSLKRSTDTSRKGARSKPWPQAAVNLLRFRHVRKTEARRKGRATGR
jgi:hypothetical protein